MPRKDAAPETPETPETEERRAPLDEQPVALAIAEEAGALPDEDRRSAEKPNLPDVPLTEPVTAADALAANPSLGGSAEGSGVRREIPGPVSIAITRVHDIFDHLVKQIDPAERIMVQELRQILTDLGMPDRTE